MTGDETDIFIFTSIRCTFSACLVQGKEKPEDDL